MKRKGGNTKKDGGIKIGKRKNEEENKGSINAKGIFTYQFERRKDERKERIRERAKRRKIFFLGMKGERNGNKR